jgi:carboxyl-terminal processing protease
LWKVEDDHEGTGSTSEVFSSGLQARKSASVVRSSSTGAALPPLIELLPTGGALQYVISNFETLDGKLLEGNGMKPDVIVRPSRQGLLTARGRVLERAISFIIGKR